MKLFTLSLLTVTGGVGVILFGMAHPKVSPGAADESDPKGTPAPVALPELKKLPFPSAPTPLPKVTVIDPAPASALASSDLVVVNPVKARTSYGEVTLIPGTPVTLQSQAGDRVSFLWEKFSVTSRRADVAESRLARIVPVALQETPRPAQPPPNLAREAMAGFKNPLNDMPGGSSANSSGLPRPLEGHVWSLAEIKERRSELNGKVVWVRLVPTSIEPDQVSDGYRVFVTDTSGRLGSYADVHFPKDGAEKMHLLRTTLWGALSFYILVKPDKLTAIGRMLRTGMQMNEYSYTW